MTATTFELRADATEVLAFIEALSADLANAPHELRKLCLDFINSGTDLVRVEDCITSGTVVTALLKPTQRFLDFGLAIRTGNFNDIVIERAHDEPPVIVVSETSNVQGQGDGQA
jgi:hypothetical protein